MVGTHQILVEETVWENLWKEEQRPLDIIHEIVHLRLWRVYNFFKGELCSTWLCNTEGMMKHWWSGVPKFSKMKSDLFLHPRTYCKNWSTSMSVLQWKLIRAIFLYLMKNNVMFFLMFFCCFWTKPLSVKKIGLLSLAKAACNMVISLCLCLSSESCLYL